MAIQKHTLPLQAWIIVVGLALMVVLLLAYAPLSGTKAYRNLQELRYAAYKIRLKNLQKDHPRRPGEYRVLIFGSSLAEHGVLADSFFNERFQNLGKKVTVNRAFYAGAYYDMLEDEDFRDFLLATQPDLLCLEDQAFLYTPLPDLVRRQGLLTEIHKNYIFNLNLLKHQLLPAIFGEPGVDANIDPSITFNIPHPRADSVISGPDSIEFTIETRDIRSLKATPQFNRTLQILREGGTDIAILHLPRPGRIEKDFFTKAQKKERDRLIEQYREAVGLEFWAFEKPLPFKYYWDISHLNQAGQKVYSEWLFEKISTHINQRGN